MEDETRQLIDRIEELERTIRRLEGRRGAVSRARSAWAAHPWLRLAVTTSLLLIPLAAYASTLSVPNTFVNGTPADADQVNANFSAVESAVNDNDTRIGVLESAPTPGDITGVLAGSGLSGGGLSGNVSLFVDTATTQSRVSGVCAPGSSIRAIASNGTVTCETDDVGAGGGGDITDVLAGTGLTGGGSSGSVTLNVATGGITTTQILDGTVTSTDIQDGTVSGIDLQDGGVTSTDIQDGTIIGADILSSTVPTFGGATINGTTTINGATTLNGAVTQTGGGEIRVHNSNSYLRFYDSAGSSQLMYLFNQSGSSWLYHSSAGRYIFRSDGNGLGIGTAPSVGAAVTMTSLQVTGTTSVGHTRVSSSYSLFGPFSCASAGGQNCYYGLGTAVCPAGMSVLGGGVNSSSARFGSTSYTYPSADDRWFCGSSEDSGGSHSCYAVCARIN